ncbi:DUF1254 domain-containing protein [Pseudaminobacter soli (ex Zhang et al. 2022)]|nr:DUF1254 domain-containing protein [Pseudaminobacter soli]
MTAAMRSQLKKRSLWKGLAYALLLGLVGAGIVHIVILLLIPSFSERNAWGRLADVADLETMVRIDTSAAGPPLISGTDPAFLSAACRFDLSDGILHVQAPGHVPFWSASVYDRGGSNLFSLTDRSGPAGLLDVVVLTPEQMIDVRADLPQEFSQSVFLELPMSEGIIVVRAFAPDASWRPALEDFFRRSSCKLV